MVQDSPRGIQRAATIRPCSAGTYSPCSAGTCAPFPARQEGMVRVQKTLKPAAPEGAFGSSMARPSAMSQQPGGSSAPTRLLPGRRGRQPQKAGGEQDPACAPPGARSPPGKGPAPICPRVPLRGHVRAAAQQLASTAAAAGPIRSATALPPSGPDRRPLSLSFQDSLRQVMMLKDFCTWRQIRANRTFLKSQLPCKSCSKCAENYLRNPRFALKSTPGWVRGYEAHDSSAR